MKKIEGMSSGSFNINTFSWNRELPLNNDNTAYSTFTMFAVGPSSFMQPYSLYEYTSTSGFIDSSTLTTILNSSLTSTIDYTGKVYMSTIPYTVWISTNTVNSNVYERTFPFYYTSTFPCTISSFISTIDITPPFNSTIISTSQFSSGDYPRTFGPYTSTGVLAPSYPFNFTSSILGPNTNFPFYIQTSNLWLGSKFRNLIETKAFNVFVDCHYSINTNATDKMWVSTIGFFGPTAINNIGRTATTRVGSNQYTEIVNKIMYKPTTAADTQKEIGQNASNYYLNIVVQKMGTNTLNYMDIYIPGENNFTFTLVPVTSTIID